MNLGAPQDIAEFGQLEQCGEMDDLRRLLQDF